MTTCFLFYRESALLRVPYWRNEVSRVLGRGAVVLTAPFWTPGVNGDGDQPDIPIPLTQEETERVELCLSGSNEVSVVILLRMGIPDELVALFRQERLMYVLLGADDGPGPAVLPRPRKVGERRRA